MRGGVGDTHQGFIHCPVESGHRVGPNVPCDGSCQPRSACPRSGTCVGDGDDVDDSGNGGTTPACSSSLEWHP